MNQYLTNKYFYRILFSSTSCPSTRVIIEFTLQVSEIERIVKLVEKEKEEEAATKKKDKPETPK